MESESSPQRFVRNAGFSLRLEARSSVGFLSAKFRVTGAEEAVVRASIAREGLVVSRDRRLDAASTQRFHSLIASALGSYGKDPSWQATGLDGVEYRGSFRSFAFSLPEFRFWSPAQSTPAHWLASAVAEAVHSSDTDERFDKLLRQLRSDLGLRIPLRWDPADPPTLHILDPYLAGVPLQFALAAVEGREIFLDVRAPALLHLLFRPKSLAGLRALLRRTPPLRWIVGEEWQALRLESFGVAAERIAIKTAGRLR
jgi:hypothetical protein